MLLVNVTEPPCPDGPHTGFFCDVIVAVGEIMDIEPIQIFNHYRGPKVDLARFAVYLISRDASKLSFPTIGYYLDREHPTVVCGYWWAKRRTREDPRFRSIVVQSARFLATGLVVDP